MSILTLRPYQQSAIDATWRYLTTNPGKNPVIDLPTGSGKSLVIASLVETCFQHGKRVLAIQHRKELIRQNADTLSKLFRMTDIQVGIHSAGLGQRDMEGDVVFAGIQSIYKKGYEFENIGMVIVDEAHLIPATGDGMYLSFLNELKVSCPKHRTVGLTATPYRLDTGLIYGPDQIFDAVCYRAPISELIADGYLSRITSKPVTQVDTSKLGHRGGEFIRSDVELLFDGHVIAACEETVAIADANDRKHVLIFCAGVQHADHVCSCVAELTGENVQVITGETLPLLRETWIEQFRTGSLRWLINVDVLTTGFDSPNVDMISIMRASESPGLIAQIIGRGLRISPDKTECIVSDFGRNIERHGPIDADDYGAQRFSRGGDGTGEAPFKICPGCDERVATGLAVCPCGFSFPERVISHDSQSDKVSPLLEEERESEEWQVVEVGYMEWTKRDALPGAPVTMRVDYVCVPSDRKESEESFGNLEEKTISEWVCIEHEGFAREKAMRWWRTRSKYDFPESAYDAAWHGRDGHLADVGGITTIRDGKFYRILGYKLGPRPDIDFTQTIDEDDELPF